MVSEIFDSNLGNVILVVCDRSVLLYRKVLEMEYAILFTIMFQRHSITIGIVLAQIHLFWACHRKRSRYSRKLRSFVDE